MIGRTLRSLPLCDEKGMVHLDSADTASALIAGSLSGFRAKKFTPWTWRSLDNLALADVPS
jgi:hypothetical protein